jgi:hypothetical protein
MMTQEQVFRVLGKWQEENTLLHVVARFPDCTMGLDCRIMGFYERSIGFKATAEYDAFEIFISGFRFDYSEPQDLESAISGERIYSAGLSGLKGTGESIAIMKVKLSN